MSEFCVLGRSEEVDGVVYVRPFGPDSMWIRPFLEFLDDHEGEVCANDYPEGFCPVVSGCDCAAPCCFAGHMRWRPDDPVVRFTPDGLEVSNVQMV